MICDRLVAVYVGNRLQSHPLLVDANSFEVYQLIKTLFDLTYFYVLLRKFYNRNAMMNKNNKYSPCVVILPLDS